MKNGRVSVRAESFLANKVYVMIKHIMLISCLFLFRPEFFAKPEPNAKFATRNSTNFSNFFKAKTMLQIAMTCTSLATTPKCGKQFVTHAEPEQKLIYFRPILTQLANL